MDVVEKHLEEEKHQRNIESTESLTMLGYTIDFAKMTLKGAFLLNGTASIATLTLFTNTLINHHGVSNEILNVSFLFALGSVFAIIATFFSYFAQIYFQDMSWEDNTTMQCITYKKQLNEIFMLEKLDADKKGINFNKERLNYIDEFNKRYNFYDDLEGKSRNNFNKSNIKGNVLRFLAIISICISIFFFFYGIYKTKTSFSNNIEVNLDSSEK